MWIMIRQTRALTIVVLIIGAISLQAQTLSLDLNWAALTSTAGRKTADTEPQTNIALARQAVAALKRLERHVIVYESLADCESNVGQHALRLRLLMRTSPMSPPNSRR
jgi:stress-induced morphogen